MKKIIAALAVALALPLSANLAQAQLHGGHGGGSPGGGFHGSPGGGGWHGSPGGGWHGAPGGWNGGGWHGGWGGWHGGWGGWYGWHGGVWFGWPYYYGGYWPYYYDDYFYDPYYYGAYPYYDYNDYGSDQGPPAGQAAPDNAAPQQAMPPAQTWYYCNNPKGYYPYVQSCRQQWYPVAPTGPSAQGSGPPQ